MTRPATPAPVGDLDVDALAARTVEIASELVRFDTAYAGPGGPAADEAALQRYVAGLLEPLGFDVRIWEPDADALRNHPMYPDGLDWRDRPVLAAVLRGTGGGRSLALNGHIDTVRCEPLDQWTRDPWTPAIDGDRLYGRGSCDMKGGIAAGLAAIEALVRSGRRLAGDLHVHLAPDEETSGMGTVALLADAEHPDACLTPEPSDFKVYAAYRGILYGRVRVTGRPAHAEIPQPDHRVGGGVSAIDEARVVLSALASLTEEWRQRPDRQHALLSPPQAFATKIAGGEFIASLPGDCVLDVDVTYLPANADADGYGSAVRREIEEHLERWASTSSWLREHPLEIAWSQDYPPAEADPDSPFMDILVQAGEAEGRPSPVAGFDTWADAATYLLSGVPAFCYGPGAIERAHMTDEWVSVSELASCARIFSRVIVDWCDAPKENT